MSPVSPVFHTVATVSIGFKIASSQKTKASLYLVYDIHFIFASYSFVEQNLIFASYSFVEQNLSETRMVN